VAATLAGDREAFGHLYNRHSRAVRAVVVGVSGEWSSADDMAQECFLRGDRKLASLENPPKFRLWIAGIARQVARERRRALSRERHEFSDAHASLIESVADDESDPSHREELEMVLRALRELPEQERLAIHAFYFQSRGAAQAAELLGLSRSGFYSLLKRATARLARVVSSTQKENR
jgi:RNA polymerase sigma-70 factor (ECF subfamily)